jgi:branched-chain amino acid transport system substrate-binding protein
MKRTVLFLLISTMLCLGSTITMAEPIKIGFIYSFVGRLGVHGALSRQGAEIAIQQLNNSGGILGRRVVGFFEDDAGDPAEGVKKAKTLIEKEKVNALMGVISTEVALEVSQAANAAKTPLIVTVAQGAAITGGKCNPYTFRVCRNADGTLRTVATLAQKLGVSEWTTVGPDTAFGHDCWNLFRKHVGAKNAKVKFAEEKSNMFASMSTTDWTPQIKQIMESPSDGLLISLYAGNLIDFLKQGGKHGLFDGKRKCIALMGSLQTLLSLGIDMPKGIWLTPPYWYQAFKNSVNDGFVKAYQSHYGAPPDYQAQFAYTAVMAYAAALDKAGTDNPQAVVKALEGLEVDCPVGRLTVRKEDHQALSDSFTGQTSDKVVVIESPQRRTVLRLIDDGRIVPALEVGTPLEESQCKIP